MNINSLLLKRGEVNMPARDGTGPFGQGALTGRRMGPCARGFNRGLGRGYGRFQDCYFYPELSKEEKIKILKAEKEDIDKALKELE